MMWSRRRNKTQMVCKNAISGGLCYTLNPCHISTDFTRYYYISIVIITRKMMNSNIGMLLSYLIMWMFPYVLFYVPYFLQT